MNYWEIIADNLSKASWSWGCVPLVDRDGRTIFVADAHRDDGKYFIVRTDEKLTAFLELESAQFADKGHLRGGRSLILLIDWTSKARVDALEPNTVVYWWRPTGAPVAWILSSS